ncbi:MAG: amidohydrolase [Planctomycetes bacterium]|nr:amidohydrolase [Planctomycetota bacterium]
MRISKIGCLLVFELLCVASTGVINAADTPATVVLRGARVVTVDPNRPEVTAVAIGGTRIVAVGSDESMAVWIGPKTRIIECRGRTVVPGFIEGHAHFTSLGHSKLQLDLSTASSWDEIIRMVAAAAKSTPGGSWIVGRGWHQGKWREPPLSNVEGYPDTLELSRAVPDHPVLLTHGTGHMVLANERAMHLAGISAESPSPPGGEILKAGDGRPIGVFRETAARPLYRALEHFQKGRTPEQITTDQRAAIKEAVAECLKYGVTTLHDAGTSLSEVDLFKELAEREELPVRLWVMLNDVNDVLATNLDRYRMIGAYDNHLTVRGIKRMIDGALGTHGAWMLEPYDDLPTSRGLNTTSLQQLKQSAELAIRHDYQLCVHAIGDRANREVLTVMEQTFQAHPEKTDLRWRIEHAQHLNPVDIPRFKKLGVIASMQGNHATSDGPFVVQRLGEWRSRTGAYAWRSLLDSGATVINGTDAPVETLNPLDSFYASVTRKLADGIEFFPEQRMTRTEALTSYTRNAAYAGFEEQFKGTITVGKLADLVVLSHDILTVPDSELKRAQVDYTIIDGRILFVRE